jgi:hypothetical protein
LRFYFLILSSGDPHMKFFDLSIIQEKITQKKERK